MAQIHRSARHRYAYLATRRVSCSAAAESGQWRVGYLSSMYGRTELTKSFVQGLSELGYIEGKSLTVEYRFASGKSERLAELATDLVRERVDLVVTEGTPSTLAAMHATTTIPISSDPFKIQWKKGSSRVWHTPVGT